MKQIINQESFNDLIKQVKTVNGRLLTNFFIDIEKLDYWLNGENLYYKLTENGLLIFRTDGQFYHLYYYTASSENLFKLLTADFPSNIVTVTDVVGKMQDIKSIVDTFTTAGFHTYAQLNRYTRINNSDSNFYQLSNIVQIATSDCTNRIFELFNENFDKYAEQLPQYHEVENLINKNNVFVIKNKDSVKGFLIFTTNGQTTLLNNFLVDKQFRGEGVGSKLIKHYICKSADIKRMNLWVLADNEAAINIYKEHGYMKDNLVDVVLKKANG